MLLTGLATLGLGLTLPPSLAREIKRVIVGQDRLAVTGGLRLVAGDAELIHRRPHRGRHAPLTTCRPSTVAGASGAVYGREGLQKVHHVLREHWYKSELWRNDNEIGLTAGKSNHAFDPIKNFLSMKFVP
jgi:hypothetical protein